MTVTLTEWEKTVTWGNGIEVTSNKVVNLILRNLNNLIKINSNNEVYTDLQLADWLDDDAVMPVWVNVGRVLQADWWLANWTLLDAKTTSWDEIRFLFADNWKLYTDNWTGTFTQIYLKPEVDALFTQLRGELSAVAFSWEYNDLLHKPVLWTASSKDVWTSAGNVPILDNTWKLDRAVVPVVLMRTFTVQTKQDLTTLSEAKAWDLWVVADDNQTYILQIEPYSTLSNWTELLTPTSTVTSVNWQTWAVTLTTNNISEANNKLYVSWTEKSTWNAKLWLNDVSTVALTGSYSDLSNKPSIPAPQVQSDWTQNNQSAVDYIKNKPTVDSAMSDSSTNAVQNKVIKAYVDTTAWSSASAKVSDEAYWSTWNGVTWVAPSKNAVYDEVNVINTTIWGMQTDITNLQTAVAGGVSDAPFDSTWDWDTTHAPSKNAIYDVLWDVETLLANL